MLDNKTLGQLFLARIKLSAKNNSLGWIKDNGLHFYSYSEYGDVVRALSLGLMHHGLSAGTHLSILSQTRKEWHLMDMATMCSRGVVIPIYPNYTASEVEYIYNHSESSIIVVEDVALMGKVCEVVKNFENLKLIVTIEKMDLEQFEDLGDIKVISYDELLSKGFELESQDNSLFEQTINEATEDDLLTIIYTSGTTGEPKGAVLTQRAIMQMLRNVYLHLKSGFNRNDRTLTFLPLAHVFGRGETMMPLIFGWEFVFAESIDKIIDNIPVVRPTVMCAVPRIFEKIYAKVMEKIEAGPEYRKSIYKWSMESSTKYFERIQKDESPTLKELFERQVGYNLVFKKIYEQFGGRIRYFVSGGAPLAIEIMKFMRNCGFTILEGYGLTETAAPCVINPLSKQVLGSVGIPIGDVHIKFADDGEILIKSVAMLKEYYKNPKGTERALKDGWFYSGDIGEFDENGYLRITDRKKDILITAAGKNIAPQKIENIMKTRPFISQCLVVGDRRKYLSAIIGIEKATFLDKLESFGLEPDCKFEDLAKNQGIADLINADIEDANGQLARFETIKNFFIAPVEFSVEGGQLTPSLKLKKKVLLESYKDDINAMYND
ncbi:MAG: long-chain fatty acid--CoA ligase [Bacteriovoracaceae bacterium]|jgi:long-chain acyl-CoA synthetase|nr:long-chain fatty acid--CoA ligase [Bacteriovoracaceae bacterium]